MMCSTCEWTKDRRIQNRPKPTLCTYKDCPYRKELDEELRPKGKIEDD